MDVSSCKERIDMIEKGTLSHENFSNYKKIQDFDTELKEHQFVTVDMMHKLETREQQLNSETTIATKMGIIADCVGAGKTYMMIAHICNSKVFSKRIPMIQNHGCSKVHLKFKHKTKRFSGNNLIVVPHSLIKQWMEVLRLSKLKFTAIYRTKHLIDWSEKKAASGGVTLCSSTFYSKLMESYGNIYWGRVIFDECDVLALSSFINPCANFYWFITSSLQNLMFPSGYYLTMKRSEYDFRNGRNYVTRTSIDGVQRRGFIRDTFRSLERSDCNLFLHKIILKNPDDYVHSILNLPEPIVCIKKCRDPYNLNILNGIISDDVVELLNAGNTQGAIDKIGVDKNTEDGIIDVVTRSLRIRLENNKQRLIFLKRLVVERQSEKDGHEKRIKGVRDEIGYLQENLKYIQDKITSAECPICYEERKFPIMLKCCKNVFCMECLSRSISACNNRCPMCRKWLESDDLLAILDTPASSSSEGGLAYNKYNSVKHLVDNSQGKKFLIFSTYDGSLSKLASVLDKKSQQISGTIARINNIVNEYKYEDLDVLLLNASHYGNGLNLENTTDLVFFHRMKPEMEKQVIGRAQRIGRTEPLRIHYMIYQNEGIH